MSTSTGHGDAHHDASAKKVTINGLFIIGFFGLVVAGMLLAVYAARYVPGFISNLSSAVYLSSEPAKNTPATTTPSKPAVVVTQEEPETPTTVVTPTKKPSYTPPKTTTHVSYPTTRVVQSGPQLYGRPDLALTSVRVGYWNGSTFIEDDRVPTGRDMAVKFTIRNAGPNLASNFLVRVRVEGQSDAIARGGLLYPNGYQNFTLRVTDPEKGSITTRIDVDYTDSISETNENNNSDSTDIDVGGSSSGGSHSSRISCDLSLSPSHIDEGDSATLRWETDNADDARFNQGIGSVDEDGGSKRVSPDEDTTYRLTVENDDGNEETCSITLRVD